MKRIEIKDKPRTLEEQVNEMGALLAFLEHHHRNQLRKECSSCADSSYRELSFDNGLVRLRLEFNHFADFFMTLFHRERDDIPAEETIDLSVFDARVDAGYVDQWFKAPNFAMAVPDRLGERSDALLILKRFQFAILNMLDQLVGVDWAKKFEAWRQGGDCDRPDWAFKGDDPVTGTTRKKLVEWVKIIDADSDVEVA